MVDVVLPLNSSVILEPADSVAFYLEQDAEPRAVLTIQNVSDDAPIAFKVKTKRPNCYLNECNKLLLLDATSRQLIDDKFLVQSVEMDQSFYERTKRRGMKEMVEELAKMWTQVDRQSISNNRLQCRFYRDAEDELQQLKQQLRQSEARSEISSTPLQNQNSRVDKSRGQDLVALQKKYDELMELVAQLSTQRDTLANDLAKTQQKLNKVSTEAQWVREAIEGAIQTSVYEF